MEFRDTPEEAAFRRKGVRSFITENLPEGSEYGPRLEEALGTDDAWTNREGLVLAREVGLPEEAARDPDDAWTIREGLVSLSQEAGLRGDHEAARALCEKGLALARDAGEDRGIAGALLALANLRLPAQPGAIGRRDLVREALALARKCGDKEAVALCLHPLGDIASVAGDHESARAVFEEMLEIYREMEDIEGVCEALLHLGGVALSLGDYESARGPVEEAGPLARRIGGYFVPWSLWKLGQVVWGLGDSKSARGLFEEAVAAARELRGFVQLSWSLRHLAQLERREGNIAEAAALHRENLTLLGHRRNRLFVIASIEGLAGVATSLGQHERAARLFGAAEAARETVRETPTPIPPSQLQGHNRDVAAARAGLTEEAFRATWAEGRAMPLQEAANFALEDPCEAQG